MLFFKHPTGARSGRKRHNPAPGPRGTRILLVNQTLIVTSGVGLVQRWKGAKRKSDQEAYLVFAGEKHWHGASASAAMTHIAIQGALNGIIVEWMEHVTDEQYRG